MAFLSMMTTVQFTDLWTAYDWKGSQINLSGKNLGLHFSCLGLHMLQFKARETIFFFLGGGGVCIW